MKSQSLLVMVLAACVSQVASAQSVATAPQKPDPYQRSTSDDEAVKQADRAVRRAAVQAGPEQEQQLRRFPVPRNIAPRRTEKAAYLGLSTSPPPAALRHQLKLPDGTALVVDFVQPNSPAQKAGIRQYDLLLKLNDQLLINAEQLAVLVRTFKPGEEIHLTLLREGEKQTPSVSLAERELPPLSDLELQLDVPLRPTVPGAPGARGFMGGGGGTAAGGGGGGGGFSGGSVTVGPGEHTLTWLDGKRQITVSMADDHKTVIITDAKTGKIMFQGPLEVMAQQSQLSPETREALARLKQFLEASSDKQDGVRGVPEKAR
jgi:hypothetical protein